MNSRNEKYAEGSLVLGLESSCDETAAAVVLRARDGQGRILSNVVRTQWERHRPYGGVVPEIAARAHVECLDLFGKKPLSSLLYERPVDDLIARRLDDAQLAIILGETMCFGNAAAHFARLSQRQGRAAGADADLRCLQDLLSGC